MKKILSILILLCVNVYISSCATKEDKFVNNKDIPHWFIYDNSGALSGVGMASPSKGGLKFQIAKAELEAKTNIAAKINSEVSRITKDALRSANVNNADDVEEFFSQASKEVVKNLPLSGVVREKLYVANDDTLYILVTMKPEIYEKYLKQTEKSFIKEINRSKLSRDNINASEEATKAIFDELEKERK